MSLQIQIGTTSEDPRCLTKNPTLGNSISCDVYEGCSVLNPRLILEYSSDYTSFNYLKIPSWNRYYFIDGIDLMPGGKAIIRAHCDVLYTYSSSIKNLEANIVRQENLQEYKLPDNKFVFLDEYDVIAKLPHFEDGTAHFLGDATAQNDYFVLGVMGSDNVNILNIPGFVYQGLQAPSDWTQNYYNYFVNVGTITNPQMLRIYAAIEQGYLTDAEAQVFNTVEGMYEVYSKDNSQLQP